MCTVAIPAKPLSAALLEVSRNTGIQFAFAQPELANRRSAAVQGRYTINALLRAMLRNADAEFRFLTPTTVLITARPPRRPPVRPVERPADERDALSSQTIIVSAFKRNEAMNSAPISIASYSQATLDQRGINDMRAIARITPGVLYRDAWAGSSNLSIRGVYSNTGSATTGVYIDDTPIQVRSLGAGVSATNIYPMLFDLERVEVLRGPQGALFGSSSEGGAIRFITRPPDLAAPSLMAEGETMITRGGEAGGEVGAAFGMPLVTDRLAIRIAAFARRDGGWIDRVTYPDGAPVQSNANRLVSVAARIALSGKIGDTVTVTPSLFFQRSTQRDSGQVWSLLSSTEQGRFANGFRIAQPSRDDFLLASLRVQADLGGLSLQSSSSYFRRRRPSTADYTDYFIEMFSRAARFSLPEVPDYVSNVEFNNDQDVFTQEVRLASREGAAIEWVAGVFAQRAQQDAIEYIHEPLLPQALRAINGQDMVKFFGSDMLPDGISYVGIDRAVDWQIAAFGRLSIPVAPGVHATVGGRFGWSGYSQDNYQDGPQSGTIPPTTTRHGETPLLPQVGLNWHPDDGKLIYLSAAKGSRLGGGNAPVSSQRCGAQLAALGLTKAPEHFASDSIWNFELGGKFALPGIKGSLSVAAYRFYWHNIQQSYSLNCLFRYTGNNAEARGNGLEFAFDMAPVPGLGVSLTGSYSRATYVETTYGGIIDFTSGTRAVVIPAGQALPAPTWRISGIARYERALRAGVKAYFEASGDYASAYGQSYAPGSTYHDPATWISPAITTARLQAGIRLRTWDAALYVDNLLDSRDALQVTHNSMRSINMRYTLLRPRTIGLRVTFRPD